MSRVVHFEMVGDDPDRMAKFYADIFGWKVQKWEGPQEYWLVITGEDGTPGINGGFGRRTKPDEGTTNTIEVEDAKATVAAVEKNGGKVVNVLHPIPGSVGRLIVRIPKAICSVSTRTIRKPSQSYSCQLSPQFFSRV